MLTLEQGVCYIFDTCVMPSVDLGFGKTEIIFCVLLFSKTALPRGITIQQICLVSWQSPLWDKGHRSSIFIQMSVYIVYVLDTFSLHTP